MQQNLGISVFCCTAPGPWISFVSQRRKTLTNCGFLYVVEVRIEAEEFGELLPDRGDDVVKKAHPLVGGFGVEEGVQRLELEPVGRAPFAAVEIVPERQDYFEDRSQLLRVLHRGGPGDDGVSLLKEHATTLDEEPSRFGSFCYRRYQMQIVVEVADVAHYRQLRRYPLDFGQLKQKLVFFGEQVDVLLLADVLLVRLGLLLRGHHPLQQLDVLQRQLLQVEHVDRVDHLLGGHLQFPPGNGDVPQPGVLEQRHVLRLLEPLARERGQPVDLAVAVGQRSRAPDLEPLLEVVEVDVTVQLVVVQLVEDGPAHLVRLQGDPVDRRQFVLGLHFTLDCHGPVGGLHEAGGGRRHRRRRHSGRWRGRARGRRRGGRRRRLYHRRRGGVRGGRVRRGARQDLGQGRR
jgi:hypothetical protein